MNSPTLTDFTAIIPTRNRSAMVAEMLQYLRNELAWECPIIVIDQSDDQGHGLKTALKRSEVQGVTVVVQSERGTNVGRNAGARLATTEWLLFLDDDWRPKANYLHTLSSYLQINPWIDAVHCAQESRGEWLRYSADPQGWRSQQFQGDAQRNVSER